MLLLNTGRRLQINQHLIDSPHHPVGFFHPPLPLIWLLEDTVINDAHNKPNVVVLGAPVALVGVQHAETGSRRRGADGESGACLGAYYGEVWARARTRDGGCELGPRNADGGAAEPSVELDAVVDEGEVVEEKAEVLRLEDAGCVLGLEIHWREAYW